MDGLSQRGRVSPALSVNREEAGRRGASDVMLQRKQRVPPGLYAYDDSDEQSSGEDDQE